MEQVTKFQMYATAAFIAAFVSLFLYAFSMVD